MKLLIVIFVVFFTETCRAGEWWSAGNVDEFSPTAAGGGEGNVSLSNLTGGVLAWEVEIQGPIPTNVVLTSIQFPVTVKLPPYLPNDDPLPETVYYRVWAKGWENETTGNYSRLGQGSKLSFTVDISLNSLGHHDVHFYFSAFSDFNETFCDTEKIVNFLSIPGVVTLLPPLFTGVVAIVFRQVLLALLLGIWFCAFFVYRLNPFIALLRTFDTYFVNSVADFEHSAILVFSFFIGGLIVIVQRSGGGLGLANLLKPLARSRRLASIVCIILGTLIFFDDYSIVLIAGSSLRTVMHSARVSKEKFAYIMKSLGPTLPCLVPISSWVGVQVGNVQMALKNSYCYEVANLDPFIVIIKTIPYRFFPLLVVFTVILISVLNRDFGPMLTAERAMLPSPDRRERQQKKRKKEELFREGVEKDGDDDDEEVESRVSNLEMTSSVEKHEESEEYSGSMAPKKGVKPRWYNAAVPFLVAIVFTLAGMVIDGWRHIVELPEAERKKVPLSVATIFTNANSIAALLWASALACLVSMVMLLAQRIFTLNEYMEAWMEGVKDMIEPYMVLWLAWALGSAIQDIQTSNFLAMTLSNGGLSPKYIPAIITVIGYLMSFAAGSVFGTMGILFPLVIPTVCKLSSTADIEENVIQSSAAILGSTIMGNLISPIAGICILTVFASQCSLGAHLKSTVPYAIIIGIVSVLFGALPVGAGWYPWYAGWIIQVVVMVLIFALFSSDIDSPTSRPLLKRLCPCLYTIPATLASKIVRWWKRNGCDHKLHRLCSCCKKKNSNPVSSDISEHSPLIS